jgi:hypothetical protein
MAEVWSCRRPCRMIPACHRPLNGTRNEDRRSPNSPLRYV